MNYDDAKLVQIHLTQQARRRAALALYSQGKLGFWAMFDYTGPTFVESVPGELEVAVGAATVNVVVDGNIEYIYPMSQVVRIKIIAA